MKTLSKKDKRAGIRVPLLSEKVVYKHESKDLEAEIGDITNEGIFIRTENLLAPRSKVELHITLPGDLGNLQVEAQVVRVNWAKNRRKNREHLGLGLRFENVTEGTQKILDAYVVYLRNKQIISVSKRIIEEFFGSKGPKKI